MGERWSNRNIGGGGRHSAKTKTTQQTKARRMVERAMSRSEQRQPNGGRYPRSKGRNFSALPDRAYPRQDGESRAREKNLVVDMAQISAGKVKKSLLEQLERAGDRNAATEDIVDQYIVARNNMLEARKQGDARKAAMEISIMGRLLGVLRVAPESKRREEIDAEIKAQLEAKHLQGPIFDDWRERFLALWDAFQAANKSLVERGRSYITVSSSGKQYEKDNSASKEIIALERALHDALQAMDITVDGYTDPEDDEL